MRIKIGKNNKSKSETADSNKITFTLEYDEFGDINLVAVQNGLSFYLAEISVDEEDDALAHLNIYENSLVELGIEPDDFVFLE